MSERIDLLKKESCWNHDKEGPEVNLKLACKMVEQLEKELDEANKRLMDFQTKGAYEMGHEDGIDAARQHVPSWENIHKAIAALERAATIFKSHDSYCGLNPYDYYGCDCGADEARQQMEAAAKGLKT